MSFREFDARERKILRSLNTPAKIQRYLDRELGYNTEPNGHTCCSPRMTLRKGVQDGLAANDLTVSANVVDSVTSFQTQTVTIGGAPNAGSFQLTGSSPLTGTTTAIAFNATTIERNAISIRQKAKISTNATT